jgi:hypothetical protein
VGQHAADYVVTAARNVGAKVVVPEIDLEGGIAVFDGAEVLVG